MSYEEILRHVAAECDEWRKTHLARLQSIAKLIYQQAEDWEKEHRRLNPDYNKPPYGKPKDPPFVHPIIAILGKVVGKGKGTRLAVQVFESEDDARLAYYTAILAVHDTTEGYIKITQGIWPEQFLGEAYNAIAPHFGDKSTFIEAALRYVEADLASTEPVETDSQQSKIGLLSELMPDDRRNEQRNQ